MIGFDSFSIEIRSAKTIPIIDSSQNVRISGAHLINRTQTGEGIDLNKWHILHGKDIYHDSSKKSVCN